MTYGMHNMLALREQLMAMGAPAWMGSLLLVMLVLVAWDACWKAWAAWRAARMGKTWWFITLLFVNTAGILPIIYLYLTRKTYAATYAKTPAART